MKYAIVFWDGIGWYWIDQGGTERRGPFTSPDGLDDAITDAKRMGYKIREVNRTRGTLPAVGASTPAPGDARERVTVEPHAVGDGLVSGG